MANAILPVIGFGIKTLDKCDTADLLCESTILRSLELGGAVIHVARHVDGRVLVLLSNGIGEDAMLYAAPSVTADPYCPFPH